MQDTSQQCYLDEFGGFGFNFEKPHVSTHFIVAGVLIEQASVGNLEAKLETIATLYFSGSEIKSSNVASNDERRLRILNDVLNLDFRVYCLIVDKRALTGEGLTKYKKSFYKYLNRLAYDELYESFPRLELFADEFGSEEFMSGFAKYVQERSVPKDMFEGSAFSFHNSKSKRLLQLADFMAGTIARCYDLTVFSPRANEIMAILKSSKKILPIKEFPRRANQYFPAVTLSGFAQSDVDQIVKQQSIKTAQRFIEDSNESDDEFIGEQLRTLEYLLFEVMYGNASRYVGTQELVDNLMIYPEMRAEKKPFGRSVIGRLRDAGVIISSNGRGYKLAVNQRDLDQFVKYYDHFISPMLARLRKCRTKVLLVTKNELDIVDSPKYEYLRSFFDGAQKNNH